MDSEPEPEPEPDDIEATVEGTLTNASTNNPIEGAEVTVIRIDEDEQIGDGTTGTDGEYEVSFTVSEDNTPDQLRVEGDADGFLATADTVDFSESVTNDFALEEAVQSEVSGQITNDDSGERINGATVTGADQEENQLFEITTDASGQYSASLELAEAPDQITVKATAEDFEGAEETVQFAEEISLNFALPPEIIDVLVDGTVTSEDDGGGIEDAIVGGFRPDEDALLADTTTAGDGSYELAFTVKAPQAPNDLRIEVSEAFGHENQERTIGFDSTLTEDFTLATAPIEISTIEELQSIGNEPKYPLDRDYVLPNNIDASETANWNSGKGFSPIGGDTTPFTGTFDGNGFEIKSLTIDRPQEDLVALFGVVEAGTIKNVSLVDMDISGDSETGGAVGELETDGLVRDTHVTGVVDGSISGGIAGENNGGVIRDCQFSGTVSGGTLLGGIVGINRGESVLRSEASGTIDAGSTAGGLVGKNTQAVKDSKAVVDVSGLDEVAKTLPVPLRFSPRTRSVTLLATVKVLADWLV